MARNSEATRERILAAAEKVFAEKGYDGARIDEIAREAEVNKALIYYYFESKEDLLNELFQDFFQASSRMLVNYVRNGGLESGPPSEADRFMEQYFSYFEKKRDLLRIMLAESLKSSDRSPPLFKLVDFTDLLEASDIHELQSKGAIQEGRMNQILVTEFFTGVVPLLMYVIFQKQWCAHFRLSQEELDGYYEKAMEMTHVAYHRRNQKQD
jgi:TetR/AcrR family transcriptional regulator